MGWKIKDPHAFPKHDTQPPPVRGVGGGGCRFRLHRPEIYQDRSNIGACRAGKHVYAGKPLALTIAGGKLLVDVVRRTVGAVQARTQQRSMPDFHVAEERLRFRRWSEDSGGKVTGWGQHRMEVARWRIGAEESGAVRIDARGQFPNQGQRSPDTPDGFAARIGYGNRVELWFIHAFNDRFAASVQSGYPPPDVAREIDTRELWPRPAGRFALSPHRAGFLDCARTRQRPTSHVAAPYRSCTVCHRTNISLRWGRQLRWNPEKQGIAAGSEANRWLSQGQRGAYRIQG